MSTLKILLVDDVDFFLEIEKEMLGLTPATILTASNGREALDIALRQHPDLIFMDVNMPVMDGLTCCRMLKANSLLRSIPVVMVFAPGRTVTEATCREAGCDGVLTKPIDGRFFLAMGRRFHPEIERRSARFPVEIPLSFRFEGKVAQGMGLDMGEGGMYVASKETTTVNQRLKLLLQLPESGPQGLEVRGRVAWVNQGPLRARTHVPEGFGVEFRSLRPEAAKILAQHLANRDVSPAPQLASVADSRGKGS